MGNSSYIKVRDKYYILAGSSMADDRTMVIKDGDAFAVFDRYGDIHPLGQGAQGLYCEGTRFLSRMELLVEGQRPIMLSSSLKEENDQLTVDLTNPDFIDSAGEIVEKGTLHFHRSKFLWKNVCYESIRICNFGTAPLSFSMSVNFQSDFHDIFEVRGMKRTQRGKKLKAIADLDELILSYIGLDSINRKTRVRFSNIPNNIEGKTANYTICMLPKACDFVTFAVAFEIGNNTPEILPYDKALEEMLNWLNHKSDCSCNIYTSNQQFNAWLYRSKSDLITMISKTPHGEYPYAGIPWYSTPFGRDGILTAWEALWIDPTLSRDVLLYLAETQAKELNDFQDAEPGKIFHETRGGEMAELKEIPFKLYYGTIDATPLFVCLAGAYYDRSGDIETIRKIWPNILLALEWIDKYGDSDGDGFVEYEKKSDKGLVNQGWKDSHDSVFYENGEMAKGPIALCEVQGYVYDAKIRAASLAEELGYSDKSEALRSQASELKTKFNEAFWSEDKQTFVIALDGEKKQCNVNSSNAGHCLFSGIVNHDKASRVVENLMSEEMFSGWGIRTIASNEVLYNPMSYHNGSIWPHDNAVIGYGFARYGFQDAAQKVLSGMFDVSKFVESERLPELFCGFNKRKNEGPTAYPVACSPQAWAVASVYLMLQACLGLKIVAKENCIYFYRPTLPEYLEEITLTNFTVNNSKLILQIRKVNNEVEVIELYREGSVQVKVIENASEIEHPEILLNEWKL